MKRFLILLLFLSLISLLFACGKEEFTTEKTIASIALSDTSKQTSLVTEAQELPSGDSLVVVNYVSDLIDGKFSKFDQKTEEAFYNAFITFSDTGVITEGNGVFVSGTTATVKTGGAFKVSGNCSNGQLIVEASKTEQVHLVFEGVSLSCTNSAPFWVKSADKVCVTLADGSINRFEDGDTYGTAIDAPKACVYAKDSLSFNGTGSLSVISNVNNGIGCTNDLKFISGTFTVSAVNNAVKGNDSIAVLQAEITVIASDDAFKSDTADDVTKGFIYIAGGTITVTATDDGLQATTAIELQGGMLRFKCGGKTVNTEGTLHKADSVSVELLP